MEATKCGGGEAVTAAVMVAMIQPLPPSNNDDALPAIGGPKVGFRRLLGSKSSITIQPFL